MPINDLVQTIVALSNLSNQRKQLEVEQQKADVLKRATDTETINRAFSALPGMNRHQRDEYVTSLRGVLPDSVVDSLSNSLPGSLDSPDVTRQQAIATGGASMSPDQKKAVGQEAYTGAATGMSRGSVAQSGVLDNLLTVSQPKDLFTPEALGDVARAAITQTATGGNPAEVATNAAIAKDPSLVARGASVRTGGMTEAQTAGTQLNWAQLNEQIDSAAKGRALGWAQLNGQMAYWEAEARGRQGLTPAQQMDARNQLLNLTTTMTTKSMNEPARKLFAAQYNEYAKMLGLPLINSDSEIPAAVKGLRALFGGGTTGVSMPSDPAYTRQGEGTPGAAGAATPPPAAPPPTAGVTRPAGSFMFGGAQ